tara:strand:- start:218 stop:1087 length:870 start_codon:yes stop_codon:yes gene_type:complete
MLRISTKEFLLWEQEQLFKGGDKQTFYVLLDLIGGISHDKITFLKANSKGNINLKKSLPFIESLWENHLVKSTPIQHLCGFTFWRDLKLQVSEKVLIPRPETELLIDIVGKIFRFNSQELLFAELGTGSGAISIALALANPIWQGIATDIDENAIDIALRNFLNYSNQSNLSFRCGHWFNPLENLRDKLDLIISNPPYIPEEVYEKLPKEVKNFEPKIALFGGKDGLEHIMEIIQYAPLYLKEKGWLVIENHFDQGARVRKLFLENRFTSVEVLKDFSGIGRFTIGRYK